MSSPARRLSPREAYTRDRRSNTSRKASAGVPPRESGVPPPIGAAARIPDERRRVRCPAHARSRLPRRPSRTELAARHSPVTMRLVNRQTGDGASRHARGSAYCGGRLRIGRSAQDPCRSDRPAGACRRADLRDTMHTRTHARTHARTHGEYLYSWSGDGRLC